MSLSESTKRTYGRELARLDSFGIKYDVAPTLAFLRKVCKTYKAHKVPFENLRLCLFALRNHHITGSKKRSKSHETFYSKDNMSKIQEQYGYKSNREPVHNTTTVSWADIIAKVRPFIENEDNAPADRLIAALYCLLPPRRTDYHSMKWGHGEQGNTLDPTNGRMVLRDYKTRKAYGPYEFDLFEPSPFHGSEEVALFRDIIGKMSHEAGPVFVSRYGGGFGMVSFASKVRALLSKICRDNITLIDVRRAFDQHIRDEVLNNARISPNERQRLRALIEKATSHSKEMTQYYADKVDLS